MPSVVYLSGEGLDFLNLYHTLGNLLCPDFHLVPDLIAYSGLVGISIHELDANKVHVYHSDKTLAHSFDSVEQAARVLTLQDVRTCLMWKSARKKI